MISLNSFVNKYKGTQVGVPWGYRGQCVSLVQRYLNECLGYDMHPRGNAKDWVSRLQTEGIAKPVNGLPKAGDIIVYGSNYGGGYGHIAVALSSNQMFDQNNSAHDNGRAGTYKIFGRYTIMRPYRTAPSDSKEKVDQILHKGSHVKFNGTFYVNRVNGKNNTFVSNTLIGGNPTHDYHWIPSNDFTECGGNNKVDQILYPGSIVKNDHTYEVKNIDIPTNSAMLNLNSKNVWVKSTYLLEV